MVPAPLTRLLTNPVVFVLCSFFLPILFIVDYFHVHHEVFPTVVALTNSSTFRLLCVNAVIASAVAMWLVLRRLFFGSLIASERSVIQSAAPLYFVECIIGPLYFSHTLLSPLTAGALFVFITRLLHKVAEERTTTIATTEDRGRRFWYLSRLATFLLVAAVTDVYILVEVWNMVSDLQPSTAIVYYSVVLIYARLILSVARLATQLVYTEVFGDDARTSFSFYMESFCGMINAAAYIMFFLYVSHRSGIPIALARTFGRSVMLFFDHLLFLAHYRKLVARVQSTADATEADLERDRRCTICYDDMEAGKQCKLLPCGHCFHERCLRRWFERHSTCPYCRADLLESVTPSASQTHRSPAAAPTPATQAPPSASEAEGTTHAGSVSAAEEGTASLGDPRSPLTSTDGAQLSDAEVERAYKLYVEELWRKLPDGPPVVSSGSVRSADDDGTTNDGASDLRAHTSAALEKAVNATKGVATNTKSREARRLAAFERYHRMVQRADKELRRSLEELDAA